MICTIYLKKSVRYRILLSLLVYLYVILKYDIYYFLYLNIKLRLFYFVF